MKNKILPIAVLMILMIMTFSTNSYAASVSGGTCSSCGGSITLVYTKIDNSQHNVTQGCGCGSSSGNESHKTKYWYVNDENTHERVCICGYTIEEEEAHTFAYAPISSTQCVGSCKSCNYDFTQNHNFSNDVCTYCGFSASGITAISQDNTAYFCVENPTSSQLKVTIKVIGRVVYDTWDTRQIEFIDYVPANSVRTYVRYRSDSKGMLYVFYRDTGSSTDSGCLAIVVSGLNDSSTNWSMDSSKDFTFDLPSSPSGTTEWMACSGTSTTISTSWSEPSGSRYLYYAVNSSYKDFMYRGWRGANSNVSKVTSSSALTDTSQVYPSSVEGVVYNEGWVQLSYECPHNLTKNYTTTTTTHTLVSECSICDYSSTGAAENHSWDTDHKCTICSYQGSHSYGSYTTITAATCTGTGIKQRSCACGASENATIAIDSTNHDYSIKCPTCNTENIICSRDSSHIKTHTCDKTGPTAPTLTGTKSSATGSAYTSGSWTNTSVYIHMSSTDTGTGVDYYQWKEGANGTWQTCNNPASFTAVRNETQYFRAVDKAGNIGAESSFKVCIEKTAPSISNFALSTTMVNKSNTSITASITATDATSGMNSVVFMAWKGNAGGYSTNKTATSTTSSFSTTYTIAEIVDSSTGTAPVTQGTYYVMAVAYDKAGNTVTSSTLSITYDTLAPTGGSIKINNDAKYTNSRTVTLTLAATDTGTGVVQMAISNSKTTGTYETYATSKSWTLTEGSGTKTVYVIFKDGAGNTTATF